MKRTNIMALLAVGTALSATAFSQTVRETFNFTPGQAGTISPTATPSWSGAFPTFTATGGYTLRRIRINGGNLEREAAAPAADTIGDNRLYFWRPGVTTGAATQITTVAGGYSELNGDSNGGSSVAYMPGDLTYTNIWGQTVFTSATGFDPVGQWSAQAANLTDNGANGIPDAWMNDVTVQFWDGATTVGTLTWKGANPNTIFTDGGLGNFQVHWYHFVVGAAINNASGTFLDIETMWNSSNTPVGPNVPATDNAGNVDTHIGLYNAAGTLITSDDDEGMGRYSAFSFGSTTARPVTTPPPGAEGWLSPTGLAFNGRDGSLAAGEYWLAVTMFAPVYEAGFTVFGGANGFGQGRPFDVRITTNAVPEPGTMIALGAGIAAIVARRRRKA